jgi:hypothetical protein
MNTTHLEGFWDGFPAECWGYPQTLFDERGLGMVWTNYLWMFCWKIFWKIKNKFGLY